MKQDQTAEDIWDLTVDDLLAPARPGADADAEALGTYVINLSTSPHPISIPSTSLGHLDYLHLYQVTGWRNSQLVFRLRLGPIETKLQAEALLPELLRDYPEATAVPALEEDIRMIAAVEATAPPRAARPKPAAVTLPVLTPQLPRPAPAAAKTVAPEVSLHDLAAGVLGAGPARPRPPAPAAAKTPAPAAPPSAPRPQSTVTAPVTMKPAAPATNVAPAAPAIPVAAVAPAVRVAPTAPALTIAPAAPPAAAPSAPTPAPAPVAAAPARPQSPVMAPSPAPTPVRAPAVAAAKPREPLRVAPAARPVSKPVPVLRPAARPNRGVVHPAAANGVSVVRPVAKRAAPPSPAPAPKAVPKAAPVEVRGTAAVMIAPPLTPPATRQFEVLPGPLPPVDATQTLRPLDLPDLQEETETDKLFVIQLALAESEIDEDHIPNLAIFNEYRLYSVMGQDSGKIMHALRLGFFHDRAPAEAVAGYLGCFFEKPAVKRVSEAERKRFADRRVAPTKDSGDSGTHAAIELRSPTSAPPTSLEELRGDAGGKGSHGRRKGHKRASAGR